MRTAGGFSSVKPLSTRSATQSHQAVLNRNRRKIDAPSRVEGSLGVGDFCDFGSRHVGEFEIVSGHASPRSSKMMKVAPVKALHRFTLSRARRERAPPSAARASPRSRNYLLRLCETSSRPMCARSTSAPSTAKSRRTRRTPKIGTLKKGERIMNRMLDALLQWRSRSRTRARGASATSRRSGCSAAAARLHRGGAARARRRVGARLARGRWAVAGSRRGRSARRACGTPSASRRA